MERILSLGRYLFPLSFLLYVGLHLGMPEVGASFVPRWLPAPLFWNYFTGILILAFIASCPAWQVRQVSYRADGVVCVADDLPCSHSACCQLRK